MISLLLLSPLWNAVAEPTTKHEAHVLHGTICFLHSHHHEGFPLFPRPPISAHCWRGSRWSSAATRKSSWGVPPPSLLCPGVTLVGKRPFEGLFNNRSQLTIWYKEHRAGQRMLVWWMRKSLFANLGLGFLDCIFFFHFFNWSIVNLQYHIIFKYTAKWFLYICVCVYILYIYTLLLLGCSVVSNSFVTPWTVGHQAPLSMRFPRQESWSGLPFPSPGDLLDPGIETHISCIGRQILHRWAI